MSEAVRSNHPRKGARRRRTACVALPLRPESPLAGLAVRQGLLLGHALRARGDAVAFCLVRWPDVEADPVEPGLRRFADRCGAAVVELPDSVVPLEGEPPARLSCRMTEWLKTRPFDVTLLPDCFGIGYYPLADKALGRAHRDNLIGIHLVGPTRQLMTERALFPTFADLVALYLEEEAVPLAPVVLAPSQHQLAPYAEMLAKAGGRTIDLSALYACESLAFALADAEGAPPAAAERGDERGPIVCLTYRRSADEIDLFCRALNRVRPELEPPPPEPLRLAFVQFGAHHSAAQRQTAFRWMAGQSVEISFARIDTLASEHAQHRDGFALLRRARLAVVPAFGSDALICARIARALNAPLITQDHPLAAELLGAGETNGIFSDDYKDLAERLTAAASAPPAPRPVSWAPSAALVSGLVPRKTKGSRAGRAARPAPRTEGRPLVTVCVTLYDRWQLMPTALKSIAEQTYRNMEIVVSDDGSDDPGAVAYLERLERGDETDGTYPPLRVVRQRHHSLGAARNNAIRHARGEYCLFMDDDNIAKPHEVAAFAAAAEASGADALSCFCDLFTDTEAVLRGDPPIGRRLFLGPSPAVSVAVNCLGDANSFFRRDAFERFGMMVEAPQLGCEDWDILARIMLAGGRVGVVPEALYWYRISPGAMSYATRRLANQRLALEAYMRNAGPFGDVLWLTRGTHTAAQLGFGQEPA